MLVPRTSTSAWSLVEYRGSRLLSHGRKSASAEPVFPWIAEDALPADELSAEAGSSGTIVLNSKAICFSPYARPRATVVQCRVIGGRLQSVKCSGFGPNATMPPSLRASHWHATEHTDGRRRSCLDRPPSLRGYFVVA